MSAVHHGILRPTFSLQEQHRCPRITYTDASLHLHCAVLLLPEQKLLLGVGEEGGEKKKLDRETSLLGVGPLLEHSPPHSPPNIKHLSLTAFKYRGHQPHPDLELIILPVCMHIQKPAFSLYTDLVLAC